jgi:hypothetical protein
MVGWHGAAVAQTQLLCISDQSTGFKFQDGKWKIVSFDIDGEKFVVRQPSEDEGQTAKWLIMKVGESIPQAWCDEDFSSGGRLTCVGLGTEWRINNQTLRFTYWYHVGYTDGVDAEGNTPNITIGKCATL